MRSRAPAGAGRGASTLLACVRCRTETPAWLKPRSPLAQSDPSLLAALRAGTGDLHRRTEDAFVLGDAARVTAADYAAVLARLAAYYGAAEAALDAWAAPLAALGLDLDERRKTPLLRRDLEALGAGAAAPAAPTPALPAVADALGLLYVLEGATLGGQLLRRRLGAALGLEPGRGLAFFAAYGDAVGPMWRAFGDALARFEAATPAADRPAARDAAIAAARAAFLAFETHVVAPTARTAGTLPTARPTGTPPTARATAAAPTERATGTPPTAPSAEPVPAGELPPPRPLAPA